jgi:hypothetical protein
MEKPLVAGVALLAPMLNYSFAFGKPTADRAIAAGNTAAHSGYATWPIGLAGGFFAECCVQPLPAPEGPYGLAFSVTGERFKLAASNGFPLDGRVCAIRSSHPSWGRWELPSDGGSCRYS